MPDFALVQNISANVLLQEIPMVYIVFYVTILIKICLERSGDRSHEYKAVMFGEYTFQEKLINQSKCIFTKMAELGKFGGVKIVMKRI